MMEEDFDVELQQLASDEIRELLLEEGTSISLEDAEHLARFIAEAGSLDEAQRLLSQLAQQRNAA